MVSMYLQLITKIYHRFVILFLVFDGQYRSRYDLMTILEVNKAITFNLGEWISNVNVRSDTLFISD